MTRNATSSSLFLGARSLLACALVGASASFLGCQSTEPAPAPEEQAEPKGQREAELAAQAQAIEQGQPAERSERLEELDEARRERDTQRTHNARRYYLGGVRYLSMQPPQIEAATREFQYALAEDPLFYKAHFKLGYTYYHRGQYAEEIAEYRKCLAINGQYLPALINLGHALLAQDSLEDARGAYLAALGVEPHNAIARYNLGLIEFDLQNFESSAQHLELFLASGQAETTTRMGDQARTCLDRIREHRSAEAN